MCLLFVFDAKIMSLKPDLEALVDVFSSISHTETSKSFYSVVFFTFMTVIKVEEELFITLCLNYLIIVALSFKNKVIHVSVCLSD